MRTFVIAEAGVNHNGDEGLALQLVDIAARCGADAVKFQTFSAAKLVRPGTEKAAYQQQATGGGDQYEMLKSLELSEALHRQLLSRCQVLGIEFMSTPFDEQAVDFLLGLGVRRIKVPSGEITNLPYLEYLARKNIPIILSSGMASLAEVQEALEQIVHVRTQLGFAGSVADMVTVLHCTSNYPARCEDVNLRAMQTMASTFRVPVGYSDHTLGIAVSTAAVAMGATVIEKHFTSDRDLPGPDHKASLLPEEFKSLVAQIRDVERALGSPQKTPADAELPIRALVRRSVTVVTPLTAGSVIRATDLALLRPGTGIPPRDLHSVVGRRTSRDIDAGATLQWSDLQ